jgi:hypothetical protein
VRFLVEFFAARQDRPARCAGRVLPFLPPLPTMPREDTGLANHESVRTTKLYERREDKLSLDEVQRISI